MSQLSKSLKKRIEELTAAIESHKIEVAAYERVLHLELAKENAPTEMDAGAPDVQLAVSTPAHGTKTAMVAEVIQSYGDAGATPKEIDAAFEARHIPRSKNLIYNTLSYLVARKRLQRRDGKYFLGATKRAAKKALKKASKKASKKVAAKKTAAKKSVAKKTATTKTVAKVKRRLSPEGLKRIREALKKRWAAKRAAEAAATKPAAAKTAAKTA